MAVLDLILTGGHLKNIFQHFGASKLTKLISCLGKELKQTFSQYQIPCV